MAKRRKFSSEPFGPAVERLMNESGTTYRGLAAKTGLSAGYLNHLVHGNRPVPSNDVIGRSRTRSRSSRSTSASSACARSPSSSRRCPSWSTGCTSAQRLTTNKPRPSAVQMVESPAGASA